MLQYDDSAFYFVALSFISIYLVPSWYTIIRKVKVAFFTSDEDIGAISRTSAEEKKAADLKKTSRGFKTMNSPGFIVNFIITIICSAIFLWLYISVQSDGEVNSFDPFSILNVDSGAELKEIKKAYKKMSLKYHPDKNPNNPAAEAMFMMVAKAYEALTDPTAKENYEKYGNPDGKQSLAVSIGLPEFLINVDNRNLVLLTYLVFMVMVIPFAVWSYYSNSSKFGEKDVMYDSYAWFHHNLNEHTLTKSLPEVLAGSAEFREKNMTKSDADKQEIGKVLAKVKSNMQKPNYNHPVVIKGNVLMHAHLTRQTDVLSEKSKEDLKYMLKFSSGLVDAMISVCKHQESLKSAINCIKFGQYVTQAIWTKDSELLQLPHFTEEEAAHCAKGKPSMKTISQYVNVPNETKKGLRDFSEEQKQDVFKTCEILPNISVETKVYVDDDEDDKVYEGDLCTVAVTMTRNNLADGEKAGLVHAPYFPYPRREAWWFALGTKEGKIITIDKVTSPDKVVTHKIKFLAPRKGQYEFDLHILSNAYVGFDHSESVGLTTMDASSLPEYKIHPDDAELDDEPTLFEEMMNANIEDDSDSDDEDDDSDDESEEEGIRELSEAEKKKQALKDARKKAASAAGDDSDSDDDSDVEELHADD
jgi:translocation protein SEC63